MEFADYHINPTKSRWKVYLQCPPADTSYLDGTAPPSKRSR